MDTAVPEATGLPVPVSLFFRGRVGGAGQTEAELGIQTDLAGPEAYFQYEVAGPGATFQETVGLGVEGGAAPSPRLLQDINVNPTAPPARALNRPIGQSPTQNAAIQADIAAARAQGATDFRVNQQQVNAAGQRVGVNLPALQYTDANGRRVYVEYDTSSSTRGPGHRTRILANDPNGTVILRTVD